MKPKKITYAIAGLDEGYWQTVREFCVCHKVTIRTMALTAIDEYMARHKRKEHKQKKEVKINDKHSNRPGQLAHPA